MKRGTPQHPKTAHLAGLLSVPIYSATGILEMLWHYTGQYAETGDITRYCPGPVSLYIGWGGDSSALVDALVASRWLDKVRSKLLVHDWHEHADDNIHRTLARKRLYFATGQPPKLSKLDERERKPAEQFYANSVETTRKPGTPRAPRGQPVGTCLSPALALPSPALPCQAPPCPGPAPASPVGGSEAGARAGSEGAGGDMRRVFTGMGEIQKQQEIIAFLTGHGAHGKNAVTLAKRRDITIEIIKSEFARISSDKTVTDPIGALFGYFGSKTWLTRRAQ